MKDVKSGIEADYNERAQTEASTSKYIQSKVPDPQGIYKDHAVANTPDDKIIKPKIKNSTCETVDLTLSGTTVSKSKSKKDIKERVPDKEKSEYGKIIVTETKGGFVEIKDETAGQKKWKHLHPAGTYNEVVNDGSKYEKIVADSYLIVDKNWNISVGEDYIEVISGNNKIHIKKNSSININGNESVNVDGNSNTKVGGNKGLSVAGNVGESIDGNHTTQLAGNLKEDIGGSSNTTVNGSENNTVVGSRTDTVSGSLNVCVTGNIMISSTAGVTITAPTVTVKGASKVDVTGGIINVKGTACTVTAPTISLKGAVSLG